MEDIQIVQKLQKILNQDLQSIGDALLSGGVDKIENYKYLVGQAHTIQKTLQEISILLKPKEQKDEQGNVIDIGNGKDRSTQNYFFNKNPYSNW